jgi:hypothetical protein
LYSSDQIRSEHGEEKIFDLKSKTRPNQQHCTPIKSIEYSLSLSPLEIEKTTTSHDSGFDLPKTSVTNSTAAEEDGDPVT